MAKKPSSTRSSMNNIIKSISCSVCMDIITEPYSLECIHSYCQACIGGLPRDRQQGQSVICCPLCKNTTMEKDIKQNAALKAVALWYQKNRNQWDNSEINTLTDIVSSHCSMCKKSTDLNHHCENCKGDLCNMCKERHDKNHKIKAVASGTKLDIPPYVNLPMYCKVHPNKIITHNCNTCEAIICQICHDIDHQEHYTEDIGTAHTRSMPIIREYLDKIDENMQELQQAIASVNKQWHNAKNNREKVRKQVLAEQAKKIKRINEDTDEIVKQLGSQDQLEIQEITTIQKDLEHNFSCQESLLTWCESIIQVTKGPGLFNELNNELYSKIEAYANEPLDLECDNFDIPEFVFQPSTLDSMNLVGTLDTKYKELTEDEINHASSRTRKISVFNEPIIPPLQRRSSSFIEQRRRPSLLAHIRRASLYEPRPGGKTRQPRQQHMYRSTAIHLNMLHSHDIDEVGNFKLEKLSQRMCYFAGKFWFPCFEEKDSCIDVYKDEELVKTFKLQPISCPHSLYPVSNNKLAVAADSGLFLLNSDGSILSHVLQGQFLEVCADENYIIALEKVSEKVQKIHVLHNNHAANERCSFTITDENADTILLHRNRIYISLYQDNLSKVVKYSVTGEKLTELGQFGRLEEGSLNFPRICAADINGSILVADCNNCRLQVADSKGKWSVVKEAVGYPWDVIIADDGFMYILCGLYHYGYVQKCKIC